MVTIICAGTRCGAELVSLRMICKKCLVGAASRGMFYRATAGGAQHDLGVIGYARNLADAVSRGAGVARDAAVSAVL